jgi:hypothetical protein
MKCQVSVALLVLAAYVNLSGAEEVQAPTAPSPGLQCGAGPVSSAASDASWVGHGSNWFAVDRPLTDATFWANADYLQWRIRNANLPEVVGRTTLADAVLAQFSSGGLPPGAIHPLFGGESGDVRYGQLPGFRVAAGVWLGDEQKWGLDGSYFRLDHGHIQGTFTSEATEVLGPTFFDPLTNRETLIFFGAPSILRSGPLVARIQTDLSNSFWGAEINGRCRIGSLFADRLEFLVGFRHLQYSEDFEMDAESRGVPGTRTAGLGTLNTTDQFGVRNRYYGVQFGLASYAEYCRFTLDTTLKIGFGGMDEQLNINGSTSFRGVFPPIPTGPGGILSQPTNIGQFDHTKFTYVPELTIKGGYRVLNGVRLTVGYNVLFVNNVLRVGDQVDAVDNRQVQAIQAGTPTFGPIPTRPRVDLTRDERFWAQGLTAGVEITY